MTNSEQAEIYRQCADNARSMITNVPDAQFYGVPDYWATPQETLAVGIGDCEDFALLVNHFCAQQGVSNTQIAICRIIATNEMHVASVFNFGELLADNRLVEVIPMARRGDLSVMHVAELLAEDIPASKRRLAAKF